MKTDAAHTSCPAKTRATRMPRAAPTRSGGEERESGEHGLVDGEPRYRRRRERVVRTEADQQEEREPDR